jgi:SAM-dependent methyltransferase
MEAITLKKVLRNIRSVATSWIAEQSLEHLEAIRAFEFGIVLDILPPRGRFLEIGAGTGWQARAFENRGYDVSAIDLPSSNYRVNRVWPVTEYDGKHIPFEDNTFDLIFSSNTLEHIPHIYEFQKEIHRVLKPDGVVLHLLPSSSWRLWTNISHLLKCWTIPKAHGERAGNALTEVYYFSRQWWARLFRETGWTIVAQDSNRLFYTGHSIMDSRLTMGTRSKLSRVLGGSCNIFVARKGNYSSTTRPPKPSEPG